MVVVRGVDIDQQVWAVHGKVVDKVKALGLAMALMVPMELDCGRSLVQQEGYTVVMEPHVRSELRLPGVFLVPVAHSPVAVGHYSLVGQETLERGECNCRS